MAWKIIFLLFCSLELRYSSIRNIVNMGQIKSQKVWKQSPSAIYVKILYTVSGIQVVFSKSFPLPSPPNWQGTYEKEPHFLIIPA